MDDYNASGCLADLNNFNTDLAAMLDDLEIAIIYRDQASQQILQSLLNVKLKTFTDIGSGEPKFNLKEYLALKQRQRESRIEFTQDTNSRIVEVKPSPLNTLFLGKKEDEPRQISLAMRRNAADKQQISKKEGGDITDAEIGSKQR